MDMQFKNWDEAKQYLINKYPEHKEVIERNYAYVSDENLYDLLLYSFEEYPDKEFEALVNEFKLLDEEPKYGRFDVTFNALLGNTVFKFYGSGQYSHTEKFGNWSTPEVIEHIEAPQFKNWNEVQTYLIQKYPQHQKIIEIDAKQACCSVTHLFGLLLETLEYIPEEPYAEMLNEFKHVGKPHHPTVGSIEFVVKIRGSEFTIIGSDPIDDTFDTWSWYME